MAHQGIQKTSATPESCSAGVALMEYMATPVSCLPVPTAARIGFDMRVRVRLRRSPAKSIQSNIIFAAEIGSKERSLATVFPQGGPVLGLTRICYTILLKDAI